MGQTEEKEKTEALIYTVDEIGNRLKSLIMERTANKRFIMRGEVTDLGNTYETGDLYFKLKGNTQVIPCVIFSKERRTGLSFEMKKGQAVLIDCEVIYLSKKNEIMIKAHRIRLDGEGEYARYIRELKGKLDREGLFRDEHKKGIPPYPRKVGIITSPEQAAIADILKVARRRNPYVQLVLYPLSVQGRGAAERMILGLQELDRYGVDTIIIGRGGGSEETLYTFNDEKLLRTVYELSTPVISAVGHEIHTMLIDLVVDKRAATPSEAAELAVPDIAVVLSGLDDRKRQLDQRIGNCIRFLRQKEEQLDKRLGREIRSRVDAEKQKIQVYEERLHRVGPENRLKVQKLKLDQLSERLAFSARKRVDRDIRRAELLNERLNGLSPTARLKGGFGYIESDRGAVQSVKEVHTGDQIRVTVHDGTFLTEVLSVEEKPGSSDMEKRP